MSEQNMRQRVNKALRPLDPISVENPAYPGTPDVNFVDGWVELEWSRAWLNRESSPLTFDHYTPHQRVCILRRWRAGGNVWLLLCVHKQWMLFDGEVAAMKVGKVPRAELEACAFKIWRNGLDADELINVLTTGRTKSKVPHI